MAEGQDALRVDLVLVEEAGRNQLLQSLRERGVVDPGDHLQRRLRDLLADHRGGLQQRLGSLEAVDARREDRLHGRRHAGISDGPGEPVYATLPDQISGLDELTDDLLDEKWIAASAIVNELGQP